MSAPTIKWEQPPDQPLQHIGVSSCGTWTAQVWDFGNHPSRPPHPEGRPFSWSIHHENEEPSDEGSTRAGHAATADLAKAFAEAAIRHLSNENTILLDKHVRETTTPMDDGTFLVDCSCGGNYSVPQGGPDEYERLEAARLDHATKEEGR